jgi:3-methyl-2-oxobutanoate hydroxymethyltransferase
MRTTISKLQKMKQRAERIPMITVYDYTSAQIADQAGVPVLLVGDSLGMVVLGYDSTLAVTLDDMVTHTQAVVRGSQNALIISDMPFLTYTSPDAAIAAARRLMQAGGAQAVKLEGGRTVAPIIRHLVESGVPVMGHIGFTPQSVHQIGMRVQGKQLAAAHRLIEDALALEEAGAFAIVLELVPAELATLISERLHIPTIGIGAGAGCDGQVQVWHDLVGLYTDFVPRHAGRYATLATTIADALAAYTADVRSGAFPTADHAIALDDTTLRQLRQELHDDA